MNIRNMLLKIAAPVTGLASLAGASSAMAVTDYSAITDAVDFGTVATAIVTVLAAVAVVLIAFKGGKLLLAAVR
jgi:hypothetical protein